MLLSPYRCYSKCHSNRLNTEAMLDQRNQEDGSLTFGHHPVEDGPELWDGDLHVLTRHITDK